jgi:hypothetical protein
MDVWTDMKRKRKRRGGNKVIKKGKQKQKMYSSSVDHIIAVRINVLRSTLSYKIQT